LIGFDSFETGDEIMEFKDFAQLLYPIIGGSSTQAAFVKTLFDTIMVDEGRDILEERSDVTYRTYFNGTNSISRIARKILPYIETENFVEYIETFPDETVSSLCDSFRHDLPGIDSFNAGPKLAELFRNILREAASQKRNQTSKDVVQKEERSPHDELAGRILAAGQVLADTWSKAVEGLLHQPGQESDHPLTPITPTRYDSGSRTIYLGTDEVVLPVQLVPQSELEQHELPYIDALCEVYAEKISQEVTPDLISTLPPLYRRHFAEQRKAYYGAESVHRSVREVFADGEMQFNTLKEDAFEGIEPTYFDDSYVSGYDRLRAVLEKITSTTLTKSALVNIVGLIGNLEKKGICHMLVNDERIRSWVVIDDDETV
jgi:hypothetical protein